MAPPGMNNCCYSAQDVFRHVEHTRIVPHKKNNATRSPNNFPSLSRATIAPEAEKDFGPVGRSSRQGLRRTLHHSIGKTPCAPQRREQATLERQ